MAVTITTKPKMGVAGLAAPERITIGSKTRVMRAEWKVSDWLKSEENVARATGFRVQWILDIGGVASKKDPRAIIDSGNIQLTESGISLDGLSIGKKYYTRKSFYPFTKKKLNGVTVEVVPFNNKGFGSVAVKQTRKFALPVKPKISAPTFNTQNGVISATITTDAGLGYNERYDTKYTKTVEIARHSYTKTADTNIKTNKIYYTRSGSGTAADPYRYDAVDNPVRSKLNQYYESRYAVTKSSTTSTTTSTSITVSQNVDNYQQLQYEDYVKFTISAYARGYAGNSATVTKTYYLSYPARPSIRKVDISSKDSYGKATINLRTNSTTEHPTDVVKLEYLANVEYATAAEIGGDVAWTSTQIVDDAKCTALSIAVTDLIPAIGNYSWVRVKAYHASEAVLYRYSNYVRLKSLETPVAPPSEIKIAVLDVRAGANGQSAVVTLGWNKNGADNYTGTELSWSDEMDTWKSTKSPEMFEFTWSDGEIYELTEDETIVTGKNYYTRSGDGTAESPYVYHLVASPTAASLSTYYELVWHDSATITIKGLTEGRSYYVKARRYLESDATFYSDYSNTEQVITSERPDSVVAMCSPYVNHDSALNITWTLSSNSLQTRWRVLATNGASIDEGDGTVGSVQISADRLKTFADENSVVIFRVEASTGSGSVISEPLTVTILDNPTLDISLATPLAVQPLTFDATVSTACDLIVIVTSQGATSQFPQGLLTQTAGDTIYSDRFSPSWGIYTLTEDESIEEGKTYYVLDEDGNYVPVAAPDVSEISTYYEFTYTGSDTITLPAGLEFWDKGHYSLSVVAEDKVTRLRSEEVVLPFDVAWANQAVSPTGAVTLTVIDQVVDGYHEQSVQIDLTPPENSNETDVYDIYRVDGDVVRLIGESFPLTCTTKDAYAPFREVNEYNGGTPLYYRVALRTVDGDVEFTDIEYNANGKSLRFDWSGGSLEFPYGVVIQDSYSKDVVFRSHMDGSVNGYWNPNVTRKSSLSTSVILLKQPNDIALARQLARYAGAVFVRTPNGNAYEADVQIKDMSAQNKAVVAISIDATEVGLTNEFALPIPYELEDEEE